MTYQDSLPLPAGTPLTMRQRRQLMLDLNPSRVSNRSQGGRSLSYLEAWDVKATLIRVFGFGGFSAVASEGEIINLEDNVPKFTGYGQNKTEIPIEYTPDGKQKFGTANFRVTAKVRVELFIHQLGARYTEYAVSSQSGPDVGEVADFAFKTAESDALKRAAIYLGTQFGLSLYNNGATQDVIKTVLASGQEWPPSPRALAEEREQFEYATMQGRYAPADQQQQTAQQEVQQLQNIVHGQRPGPVMQAPGEGESSLTPELREHTNALIERGLQMKRANGDPQIDNGPAGVLDPSFDDNEEMGAEEQQDVYDAAAQ